MQKGQYQGQCQYSFLRSFYPYTSIHVFNWETLFSLYLSYLYQIKCPRIYSNANGQVANGQ